MDIWLYFDVTHRHHRHMNPVSEETVRELEGVLGLSSETRVLDIACGMGEMLLGFAERHGAGGVGVDISPYAIRHAKAKKSARAPGAAIEFLGVGGAEYEPEGGERFDVTMCIGASWIWKGFEGTLRALTDLTKPGGLVVSGEPYWKQDPPAEYLEMEGLKREEFFDLWGCRQVAARQGLGLVWMRGSTLTDWDRYEMTQSFALDRFARENPDHPDLEEIRGKHAPSREAYLRWGRDCLGFAFWVFRVPDEARN